MRAADGRRRWTVRDGVDDVVLDLEAPWTASGKVVDVARGCWDLERLLQRGLRGGEVRLQQALLDVHEELGGRRPGVWTREERIESVTRTLMGAAGSGRLVVRRQPVRMAGLEHEGKNPWNSQDVLGPEPTQEAPAPSKTWLGINLVDQDGNPVPARAYRVVLPGGAVVDGQLDSHGAAMLKDVDPGSCKVSCPYVEPHPALTHAVQPGEHLSGIAQAYGFDDYTVVWNDPNNAELRKQRTYPHELVPGDQVHVPEWKDKPADKPTGAKHTFTVKRSPLKLRVKVLGLTLKPLASAACTLDDAPVSTDGGGVVEEPVDKTARAAFLAVQGANLALQVGRLSPVDDASDAGWKARLFNLGFLLDPEAQDGDQELRIALEDFQAQYELQVTGAFDDATKAQLKQTYGC